MMLVTEDNSNSEIIDGKAFKALIITSLKTLKRGNKNCDRKKLVNDSLCNKICKDLYNKTPDNLIEYQSVNCKIFSNRKCISLPKHSKLHHCFI